MNIIAAETGTNYLSMKLDELAEMITKRDALRKVYALIRESNLVNECYLLNEVQRSAAAINRRVDSIMRSIAYGVYR